MPSTPPSGPWRFGHLPAAHAARDSQSTISGPSNRWSLFSEEPLSEFAPSSAPSSPVSNHRNSMFDRAVLDQTGPASPTTSVDPMSPTWLVAAHRKHISSVSARSVAVPIVEATGEEDGPVLANNLPDACRLPDANARLVPKLDTKFDTASISTARDGLAGDDRTDSRAVVEHNHRRHFDFTGH